MTRAILHSDLNAFYASVEVMLDPSLRGKAVAVCGSTEERHGIVLAKSELAKKAGIKTGMVKPRFTLMHECAHHLLHKGYFQRKAASGSGGAVAYSLQKDEERLFTREKKIWTDEERIEWQANYLASALLIPGKRLDRVLDERGYQEDYFHHVLARSSEPAAYRQLTSRIACAFKVSLTVAEIRLKALKFERLPDLRIPKPDPWACYYGEPKKKRMTKEERQWEKAERSWEKARERELSRKYE